MKPFVQKLDELTPEMVALVDRVVEEHQNDPTQLVGILLDIQDGVERHYIPEPVAYYLSQRLSIRVTQIYDVVTFYSMLYDKPRAKYTLEVCNSAPCRVKDSDTLVETLKRLLNLEVGEVTYDGRFCIEKVPCFGACDVSPAVRVNGVVYGNLSSEERILDMLRQLD